MTKVALASHMIPHRLVYILPTLKDYIYVQCAPHTQCSHNPSFNTHTPMWCIVTHPKLPLVQCLLNSTYKRVHSKGSIWMVEYAIHNTNLNCGWFFSTLFSSFRCTLKAKSFLNFSPRNQG